MIRFDNINLKHTLKMVIAFIASVITTYVIACIFQSIFVLAALERSGANFPIEIWFYTIGHDFYGLTFLGVFPLGLAVIVGFIIAIPSAALVHKYLKLSRWILYPLACATAMITIRYCMSFMFFDLTVMVGTRSSVGLSLYLVAGALGGAVFKILSTQQKSLYGKSRQYINQYKSQNIR